MRDFLDPVWLAAHHLQPWVFLVVSLVGQSLDPAPGRALRSHALLHGPLGTGTTSALVTSARRQPGLSVVRADIVALSAGLVRSRLAALPARDTQAVPAMEAGDGAPVRDDLRQRSRTRRAGTRSHGAGARGGDGQRARQG